MSGYPGNLSDSQAVALEQMKTRIADIWSDKFTDHFLLRWLRAREFDVPKAENLLREDVIWRTTNSMDTILKTYKPPEVLQRYLPGGLFSHDKEAHPVWIMPFGDGDYRGMLQCHRKADICTHVTYLIEEIMEDLRNQTEKMGKVVDTLTVVFDFDNYSLRQLYCWQAIELARDLLTLYEGHYPETLAHAIIINAPGFFPVFWKLIRPFLAKRTADKVEIYSREGWQAPLLQYVEPSQLPVHWGGELVGPDGNTKCSHKIGIGGKVPEELYSKNAPKVSCNPKSTTCVLEPGESMEVPVSVTNVGAVLDWKFQTCSGQDIDFNVVHTALDTCSKSDVLETRRVRCDKIPESGQMECMETGTYTFKFDNGFSWFAKKQLCYVIQVHDGKNSLEDENTRDEGFESETV